LAKEFHSNKIQVYFSNIFPSEPITLSFTGIRIIIIGVIFLLVITVLYFRISNINELQLLESKHSEIQLIVDKYLNNMSSANVSRDKQLEIDNRIAGYKKQLLSIEHNIKNLRKSWIP
jgi:hypothetical protein